MSASDKELPVQQNEITCKQIQKEMTMRNSQKFKKLTEKYRPCPDRGISLQTHSRHKKGTEKGTYLWTEKH